MEANKIKPKSLKEPVQLEMENEEYSGQVAIKTLKKNATLRKKRGTSSAKI
jgi:hypothetical protein